MYAIMLARAFTGRQLVVKVAGGWHGVQPWALKGVDFHAGPVPWTLESEGLPAHIADEVVVARFNEPEDLAEHFRRRGDDIACLIVEPFAGARSFMAATPEYLTVARELTERHGALLVLDEVISAFRFCAGDLGALYGIRPDLLVLGKIVGGGMPVAAVAGRADVLALCGKEGGGRVAFSGGTYSAHPACLLAARTMVSYLVAHESEIYPRLADLGDRLRRAIEDGFAAEGLAARCSGAPSEVMAGSSLAAVHFPRDADIALDRPHLSRDPASALRDHPRSYGTFPRVLGKYVREERVLPLEAAVRKMTSLPAERFGLRGRGRIAEGSFADLTLFDAGTVAGGARLHAAA